MFLLKKSENLNVYLKQILPSIFIVYCFYLLQVTFVFKAKISPLSSFAPIVIGIIFGTALARIKILSKKLKTNELELEKIIKEKTSLAEETQQLFQKIFEFAPISIGFFDKNGNLLSHNRATSKIFGIEEKEVGKFQYNFFLDPNLTEEAKQNIKKGLFGSNYFWFDFDLIKKHNIYPTTKSGKIYLEGKIIPLFDENSNLNNYLGMLTEHTEKKQIEENLKVVNQNQKILISLLNLSLQNISLEEQLNQSLKLIISAAFLPVQPKGGIFLFDEKLNVLTLKASYRLDTEIQLLCQTLRLGQCLCGRAAKLQQLLFFSHADENHENCFSGMPDHGHYNVPILHRGKLLGVFVLYLHANHQSNQAERDFLEAISNTLAGIIEKKRIEQDALRSQRLESLGKLAGGIAHDLNNIFTPILVTSQILKMTLTSPKNKKNAEIIFNNTLRGANILKQILFFAKGLEGNHSKLKVEQILERTHDFISETFPKSIDLELKIAQGLWNVYGDFTQIDQVLLNLCLNAKDSMAENKKNILEISAENVFLNEDNFALHPKAKKGVYVKIEVCDNGCGISEEFLGKIFDPFFTTKGQLKGTGLGLSTVHEIMERHKGFVVVRSELGKGTKFSLFFPAIEDSASVGLVAETQATVPLANKELLLLVDDEAEILEILKEVLEQNNYRVLTASNGAEAIGIYEKNRDELKAVVSDIMMPIMDGKLTIETLQKMNKNLKIIVTSGLEENNQTIKEMNLKADAFLAKPFPIETLLNTLHNLLN
ncbi:response regulator [bacterium]|nr:response regulator [bacterium]